MKIDLELLKTQKAELLDAIESGYRVETMQGIVNLLDSIQDKLEDEKPIDFTIQKEVKILITVEGGIVQNINANIDAKIVVIDYDDKGDDPVYISEIMEPNNIVKDNFHSELFQGEIHPSEQIAKETLKELNF